MASNTRDLKITIFPFAKVVVLIVCGLLFCLFGSLLIFVSSFGPSLGISKQGLILQNHLSNIILLLGTFNLENVGLVSI